MSHIYVDTLSLVNANAVLNHTESFALADFRGVEPISIVYGSACAAVEAFVLYDKVCADRDTLEFDNSWVSWVSLFEDILEPVEPPDEDSNLSSLNAISSMLEMPHPFLSGLIKTIQLAKNCIDTGYIESKGIILPKKHYREVFLEALPEQPSEYCKLLGLDVTDYKEPLIVTLYHLYRTIYYSKCSKDYWSYLPHRFRSTVYRSSLEPRRLGISALAADRIRTQFEKVESILGQLQDFTPNMPPIGDAIIKSSSSLKKLEENIRELRARARDSGYYEYMDNIETDVRAGKRNITINFALEIEKAIKIWLEKLRIQNVTRKISVTLIPGVVTTEINVKDKTITTPGSFKHLMWMFDVLTWPGMKDTNNKG